MAIKAFVGHSFLTKDRDVVGKFLDFFNHVSDLGLDFSWDHAEGAELKELSIKVKEKMNEKNLFIGICTSRQKSIDFGNLKRVPLTKKMYWGVIWILLRKHRIGFCKRLDLHMAGI